ncbi:MAG: amino acid adenylation domain-containing protein, partial [Myxococcales bacterium]|nr:amino acid adenylation domain-containing protein [Myxococcales bacterium]
MDARDHEEPCAATGSPLWHPYLREPSRGPGVSRVHALERFGAALAGGGCAPSDGRRALGVVAAYLLRAAGAEAGSVGLVCGDTSGQPPRPLGFSRGPDQRYDAFEVAVCEALAMARSGADSRSEGRRSVEVCVDAPTRPSGEPDHAALRFGLPSGGATPWLRVPADQPSWQVDAIDAQLACVARVVGADPRRLVAALPLVDGPEREQLLYGWNETARPLPERPLHAEIEAQARRTPDALAVCFDAARLSFAELDARANQLAHALVRRGVRRGDRVALCVGRGTAVVVGALGVLKAGAAYVPLDPGYPQARVRTILDHAGVRVAVTERALAERLLRGVEHVCVDAQAEALASMPSTPIGVEVAPEDLAYVIFTSGSTGEPKGVEIRHRSVLNHGLAIAERYGLGAGSRVLCSASLGFDVAAEQIYPALLSGGAVVVRPDDLFESFERFEGFVERAAISTLILPTAFWHEWVRGLERRGVEVPGCVRVVAVGTERVLAAHLGAFVERCPRPVRFFQGYGPTEATITCTLYAHEGGAPRADDDIPIGRPLANTRVVLLDAQMEPVPVGFEGEIYVGGAGVARGYVGRRALTDERFVRDPFDSNPAARLYRTGDLARRRPDGQLVFVGRADFQVKIRGHRVELGEIEEALRTHPRVDRIAVLLRDGGAGPGRLVAYVVTDGRPVNAEALEASCAARLPAYMVPDAFVFLEAFPLTAHGKIDRAALPAPRERPCVGASARADQPRDDLELIVLQAFENALGAPVGATESFFDAGGDSLRALDVLTSLGEVVGRALALGDLFDAPSARALAAALADDARRDVPRAICLREGTGTPVFFVCGIHLYHELAQALGAPNPAYALFLPVEAALLEGDAAAPSVSAWAGAYIEAMRTKAPEGPYVLGGASFGGVLALEMARQLEAAGERIEGVVLLDSALPRAHRRSVAGRVREAAAGALRWARRAVHGGAALRRRAD